MKVREQHGPGGRYAMVPADVIGSKEETLPLARAHGRLKVRHSERLEQ